MLLAGDKRLSSVLALRGSMRVAVRAAILVAAVAGVAIEVWAIRAGWSWVAAALDLLAGWSLLAAAGWAMHLTGGCRGLLGLSGVFWFLATPQVVGGTAGHAAALLGGVWLAPLATAMLGSPRAVPAGWLQRAVAAACWVRAVPALAGIGWLTAATGGCLALAALADAPPLSRLRCQRWAAAAPARCLAFPACWRRWPAGLGAWTAARGQRGGLRRRRARDPPGPGRNRQRPRRTRRRAGPDDGRALAGTPARARGR